VTALVTGGAGFIGSNVAARLLSEGRRVRVLDDLSTGYRVNVDAMGGVEFREGDIRDAALVDECAEGCDVIFHLAASVGNTRALEDPVRDSEVNVLGTINVVEAARRHGVRKVVCSSSAGIFGELRELPIGPGHPIEPDTPYGVSKLASEKMCLAYARLYGFEAVALRYFNVYGVNQRYDAYGNVIPIFVQRLLTGQPLVIYSDGEQTRDFVNAADVVEANLRAARAEGVQGAFNIGSATRVTVNHLVELLHEVSGADTGVEYAQPRPGDVRDSLADISAATEAFGYEPAMTLRDGLEEYIAWAREEARRAAAEANAHVEG
jgi:UDP-glucose 4-epimerase